MKLKHVTLFITISLSMNNAESASTLQDLLSTLIGKNATGTQNVLVSAQVEPYISKVLNGDENACNDALSTQDFQQMQYDQQFIKSMLDLYRLPEFDHQVMDGSNLYMSILLQKIRSTAEAITENELNAANINFINDLSQADFAVASFTSHTDLIRNIGTLIKAHQSMELSTYNVDGYIKLVTEEFKKCSQVGTNCAHNDQVWNKWSKTTGFGIINPAVTTDMASTGNTTAKENFEINLSVGSYSDKDLDKNLFEMINIYGGPNFDYLSYLKGEALKTEQAATTNGPIYAPGKVVAGLLLKLANQRLIAYYKYQRCRSLNQNNANLQLLSQAYYSVLKPAKSSALVFPSKNKIIQCKVGGCPIDSVQVTAATPTNKAMAIIKAGKAD